MIDKILIANRGEIAVRIIQACRELGIASVAVYSKADEESLHVKLADQAICIGSNKIDQSYLNTNNILQAAISTGAQAIHPGYGFLSENSSFAQACANLNIEFIGPSYELINLMGNKINARKTMEEAGVPVVPGYDGLIEDEDHVYELAKSIGVPVIIKAAAGGGGKGMRIAYTQDEVKNAYNAALNESKSIFNDDSMYVEKFVSNPRHIEVQVIGDKHKNYAHLFERECSMQRNNQKMIEEAPAGNLKQKTRDKLYDASLKAIKHLNYESVGTLEFIMDDQENFYFIEMNTRIQVEHPVTEQITGVDLIKEQIRIASNQPLSFKQEDLKINGHAIEVRINSEDPFNNFNPSAGCVKSVHFATGNGIRIDSLLYNGYFIPPFYDSMIAKLIVHGSNRNEAIEKAIRGLEETDIDGIKTNIDFQLDLLLSKEFQNNTYTTAFVAQVLRNDANV